MAPIRRKRQPTVLGIVPCIAAAVSLKLFGVYLGAREAQGFSTLASASPLIDALLSIGAQGKEALRSRYALALLSGVSVLGVARARFGSGAPWKEIGTTGATIYLLLLSLWLRSAGRPGLGFIASLAASLVVPFSPISQPVDMESQWSRAKSIAVATVVTSGALLVRLYALAEHPRGYPEHAVTHNMLALNYYERLLSFREGVDFSGLWNAIMVQFGLQSLLEAISFKVFGIGLLQSMALPALLGIATVGFAYLFGVELFGPAFGLVFSYICAVSSWQIAFSRYGDPEHILAIFQLVLTLFLAARALRRLGVPTAFFAGLSLGLSWFVYGTNQIFPIIVIVTLAQLVVLRRDLIAAYRFHAFAFAAGFLLMSGDAFHRTLASGHFYPLRPALPGNENYQVVSLSSALTSLPRVLAIMTQHTADAWLSRSGGALSELEIALFLPALAAGILCVHRRIDRGAWCFLLTGLALSFIPAIASPDVNVRRLMVSALFFSLIVAAGLTRILQSVRQLLPAADCRIALAFAAALHFSASTHTYFLGTSQPHSEDHSYHTAIARFFARQGDEAPVKAFVGNQGDVPVQDRFIKLAAYAARSDAREKWEWDAHPRYVVSPKTMSDEARRVGSCGFGGQVVLGKADEKALLEAVGLAGDGWIDLSSRTEVQDRQAGVSLVVFRSRWCSSHSQSQTSNQ